MKYSIDKPDLVVGVVGTGTMGRGIMQAAATAGCRVRAFDSRDKAAENATASIGKALDRLVEKERLTAAEAREAAGRIDVANSLLDLVRCDVVIEAIVENLQAKRALFGDLDRMMPPASILATNTSSLSVTEIAAACANPERVGGLHFFNPVPLMQLVEIIPGVRTSAETTEALLDFGRRLQKQVVCAKDTPGFLVNHIGRAYMPEALRILSENIAAPEAIDALMRECAGFRMGPFELLDLVGLDVAHPVMEAIHQQYYEDPMYRPSNIARVRLAGGLLGQKTGQGFYRYEDGRRIAPVQPAPTGSLPDSVWVSRRDPEGHAKLAQLLSNLPTRLETGASPGSTALCVITPLGRDATSAIQDEGLDPERTVAIDTCFDISKRRTVMTTPATTPQYRAAAQALFSSQGAATTLINDSPGFVAQRIAAMIVNVGCNIAQQGIATPENIDLGARLGLNYPFGPLELGNRLGPQKVLRILEELQASYGEDRYRPSPWMRRRAQLGLSLLSPEVAT